MTANSDFITPNLQEIMQLLYNKGEISFYDQDVIKSREWFFREMDKLVKFQKVDREVFFINGSRKLNPHYRINPAGKMFVELFILKYQERVCNRG